jgi:hypothetical protein
LGLVGPEDMVEEFLLPNRAFAIEQSVDPPCGWTFDGIYNLGQGVGRALRAAKRRVDQVHVGGHNNRRMRGCICGRTLSGSSRERRLGLLRKLPATIRGEGDEVRGISFFIAR